MAKRAKSESIELFYWKECPGRGEFIRMILEDAGIDYVDVCREKGSDAMDKLLKNAIDDELPLAPPLAPPFIRDGEITIAQV